MAAPSHKPAESQTLWHVLKELLHLKGPSTLRASIEEAIEEHAEDGVTPGDLDPDERAILRNMLKLNTRKAGDVAVPRSDIVAVGEDQEFRQLLELFRMSGHSRLPVYQKSLDDVIGMLHVKDIYAAIVERFERPNSLQQMPPVRDLLRTVLFVPPSMPLVELLTRMRRKRTHMAILVDEYGGTDGLITIEDVVEEIVGEIEDEHDEVEPVMVVYRTDGSIEADARIMLDELEEEIGTSFVDQSQSGDVETLGGLAVLLAGRIPTATEQFTLSNGWSIEVMAADGQRVHKLRLHRPDPSAQAADLPD